MRNVPGESRHTVVPVSAKLAERAVVAVHTFFLLCLHELHPRDGPLYTIFYGVTLDRETCIGLTVLKLKPANGEKVSFRGSS